MKNYQKPELEYVVLTTVEEIANSTQTPGASGGVTDNPFGPPAETTTFGNWTIG